MTLYTLTATFGCLENATLSLRPGLNLLEAANESGKSTWCAFLRAMFYGLESRKGGANSERNRYTPWSGAPMRGSVDLEWQGRRLTLRRFPKGQNPFGGFQAVYTGTEESVPGLTGDNVGETILGCGKEVFERTCFIAQGGMRVDKSGELERRVAALASSGEEDVSYSQTERRLRDWRNALQSNRATGSIPRLQAQLTALRAQRARLEDAQARAHAAQEAETRLAGGLREVEEDLARHRALAEADYALRYEKARAALAEAQARHDELARRCPDPDALPSRETLRRCQGECAYLHALAPRLQAARETLEERRRGEEEAGAQLAPGPFEGRSGAQAVQEAEALAARLSQPPRARFSHWIPLFACALAAVALLVVGLVTRAIPLPVLLGVSGGALAAGALASILVSAHSRRKAKRARRAELARYGVESPQSLAAAAQSYAHRHAQLQGARALREEAQRALDALEADYAARFQALSAQTAPLFRSNAPSASLSDLSRALEEALSLSDALTESRRALQSAQAVWEAASAQGEPTAGAGGPTELPRNALGEDEARRRALERELALASDARARALGELGGLGDPEELEEELDAAQRALEEQTRQLQALTLALDVLQEANAQLQSRFSPAVSKTAGELLSRLTGGRWSALAFTRDFQALARSGDALRSAQTLSQGTADQAYLALRLAICLLALPQDEPAPLVLDDALVTFDAARLALALDVLRELAQTRQVLLFTCQDREGRALSAQAPGPAR